jgi:hypothetical protein
LASYQVVLDSGALSAFAEAHGPVRTAIHEALGDGAVVVVPTAVIAESTTGDHRRDANVNRALKCTSLVPLGVDLARSAAALRYARRGATAGTVDAIVVATADAVPGTDVLTADQCDLAGLAAVKGRTRIVALSDVDSWRARRATRRGMRL